MEKNVVELGLLDMIFDMAICPSSLPRLQPAFGLSLMVVPVMPVVTSACFSFIPCEEAREVSLIR